MGTVTPIRPDVGGRPVSAPVPRRGRRWAICPVCTLRVPLNEFAVECDCGTVMHEACYWGRLVPIEEWQAYCRVMTDAVEGVYDDGEAPWPQTRCETCRAKGGA